MSRQQVRRMGFGAMGLGVLVLCLLVWGLVWAEDVKINTIGEKPADGSGVQAADGPEACGRPGRVRSRVDIGQRRLHHGLLGQGCADATGA